MAHLHPDGKHNMVWHGVEIAVRLDPQEKPYALYGVRVWKQNARSDSQAREDCAAHFLDRGHNDACGPVPEESTGG